MNKNKYESPSLEIIKITQDIITTSGDTPYVPASASNDNQVFGSNIFQDIFGK